MAATPDQSVTKRPSFEEGTEPVTPLGRVGRYILFNEIAAGGMATVHFGRLEGASGFARVVALKRLHPHVSAVPEAAAMLRDEAWLSARVRHPNVLSVLDVVESGNELLLVMEYVEGVALSRLLNRLGEQDKRMPLPIVGAIVGAVLSALEAAHAATAEDGSPLGLIHRDVSPQNVLLGFDGTVRLGDFGVAKARGRILTTQNGELKGKIPYMAPEQVMGEVITSKTDLFAAGVVLFECLTGRRLREQMEPAAALAGIIYGDIPDLDECRPGLPSEVSAAVKRALARDPNDRFEDARAMANALEGAFVTATPRELATFIEGILGDEVQTKRRARERIERAVIDDASLLGPPPRKRPVAGAPPVVTPVKLEVEAFVPTLPAAAAPSPQVMQGGSAAALPSPASALPLYRNPYFIGSALIATAAVVTFLALLAARFSERPSVAGANPAAPGSVVPSAAASDARLNAPASVAPTPPAVPDAVESAPVASGRAPPKKRRPPRSPAAGSGSSTGLTGIPSDRDPL